jgi:alanine racemase
VDTGMHRIGVDYREALAFVRNCYTLPYIQVEGIFSHLACAESSDRAAIQFQRWQHLLRELATTHPLPKYLHFANSTGALCYSTYRCNLVRVGFAFYGYLSQADTQEPLPRLRPVMGLKARIMRLHQAAPESGISYGYTYQTPPGREALIATLPLGYADGVPRILSNRIEGLLRGVRVPQVGNITMDQMMFDVSALPDAAVGETITLLGSEPGQQGPETITLSDWAQKANTIEYELMCALRVRLPKTYTRH